MGYIAQICYVNSELSAECVEKVVKTLTDGSEVVKRGAVEAIRELVHQNHGEPATKAIVGYMKAKGSLGDFADELDGIVAKAHTRDLIAVFAQHRYQELVPEVAARVL